MLKYRQSMLNISSVEFKRVTPLMHKLLRSLSSGMSSFVDSIFWNVHVFDTVPDLSVGECRAHWRHGSLSRNTDTINAN